jgi:hypothetical protein
MARTDAEMLAKMKEIRDAAQDRLLEVLSHPKPTYTVDGQEFQWTEYCKMLKDQIAEVSAAIAGMDRGAKLTMTSVNTGN